MTDKINHQKLKIMNTKTLGLVVIIIGILMILYTGFNLMTSEKVFEMGGMEMSMNKSHPVQWSPIVGVVLLAGGIVLVALNKKK